MDASINDRGRWKKRGRVRKRGNEGGENTCKDINAWRVTNSVNEDSNVIINTVHLHVYILVSDLRFHIIHEKNY